MIFKKRNTHLFVQLERSVCILHNQQSLSEM